MSSPQAPARAVFAPSRLHLLVAVTLAVCAVPFAFGAPWFWLVYLVPLGLAAWVLWARTTVDAEAVTTRNVRGTRRVPWSDVRSLRLRRGTRVRGSRVAAVLADGEELALPAVGVHDVPVLAAVSGGRIPDPSSR